MFFLAMDNGGACEKMTRREGWEPSTLGGARAPWYRGEGTITHLIQNYQGSSRGRGGRGLTKVSLGQGNCRVRDPSGRFEKYLDLPNPPYLYPQTPHKGLAYYH